MSEPAVELSDLAVFLTLAEELHFGRTAERVGLSQSRVSQIIRRIEGRIGGQLVARTSRHVALTPLGQRLRDDTQTPYYELRGAILAATAVVRTVGAECLLGFVSGSADGGPRLQEIIDAFGAEHPGCRVRRVELPLSDPLGALRRREIDAMCSRLPLSQADLKVGPELSAESRVLLVSRGHPLSSLPNVTYEHLGDFAVADVPTVPHELVSDLLPWVTPAGRAVDRGPTFDNMSDLLSAVAAGVIVQPSAVSTQQFRSHPNVIAVPIVDAPLTRTGLVSHRVHPSRAAVAFVATAARVLAT